MTSDQEHTPSEDDIPMWKQQKYQKPPKEKKPEAPRCDYIKRDGNICNSYCMKQETANRTKCHAHQILVNKPCLHCGRPNHSTTGYCASFETGCRYKAIYHSRKMKKELEKKSASMYTEVDQTLNTIDVK